MKRLLFLAALLALSVAGCAPDSLDGLDDAMQGYLDAIHEMNPSLLIHYFPKHGNWQFISYRAGTSKIVSSPTFTYAQTEDQFEKKTGIWWALITGTESYHYPDRIAAHPLSKWIRDDEEKTYRIPPADGISYVTWEKEDGRWVISAIGDDSP